MYQVYIEIDNNKVCEKKIDVQMTTEKLDETIGRYTRKYGPPLELVVGKKDVYELEFYKKDSSGYVCVIMQFQKLSDKDVKHSKEIVRAESSKTHYHTPVVLPPPPPLPPFEEPEIIKDLIAKGALLSA